MQSKRPRSSACRIPNLESHIILRKAQFSWSFQWSFLNIVLQEACRKGGRRRRKTTYLSLIIRECAGLRNGRAEEMGRGMGLQL